IETRFLFAGHNNLHALKCTHFIYRIFFGNTDGGSRFSSTHTSFRLENEKLEELYSPAVLEQFCEVLEHEGQCTHYQKLRKCGVLALLTLPSSHIVEVILHRRHRLFTPPRPEFSSPITKVSALIHMSSSAVARRGDHQIFFKIFEKTHKTQNTMAQEEITKHPTRVFCNRTYG